MAKNTILIMPIMAFQGEPNCTDCRAIIRGNTFPIKDAIKSVCKARWNNGEWDCLIPDVATMDALIDVCAGFEVSGRDECAKYLRKFGK